MTAVERRITILRVYEQLKERYERGDKDVIKTGDFRYKQIGPTGDTIIEVSAF